MSVEYEVALIKQIIAEKQDIDTMLDRIIVVLDPRASDSAKALDPVVWKRCRDAARTVLERLFLEDQIKCPRCGADTMNAEILCTADGNCPVTPGG